MCLGPYISKNCMWHKSQIRWMNIISPHLYIQYVFWWLTSLIYQAPTYFIQLNLIDKMEQFDAMVVLMEITFQNGMSRNAVWLINVMARYFGSDSFCLNCLKYLNEYENTSIFYKISYIFLLRRIGTKLYTFIYKHWTDCDLRLYE